jgi:hypothetical protein
VCGVLIGVRLEVRLDLFPSSLVQPPWSLLFGSVAALLNEVAAEAACPDAKECTYSVQCGSTSRKHRRGRL